MSLQIAYLPLGRVTFHQPSAESIFQQSVQVLQELFPEINISPGLLTSPEMVEDYLRRLPPQDLVIYQCTTFVGGEFAATVTRLASCPVLVWAVDEPVIDGGRLRLNSLTGAFAAGNSLTAQGRPYLFVSGAPTEQRVRRKLQELLAVLRTRAALRQLVAGVVGSFPPGFAFGDLDESLLAGQLGVRVVRVEAAALMERARGYQPDEVAQARQRLLAAVANPQQVEEPYLEKYARLMQAYQDFVRENKIGALASRCWPDFFVQYGVPVCAVLSLLTDSGVPAACEADLGGALSMFTGSQLAGGPAYLGDPVALEEEHNSLIFWHCGAGACSLARPQPGARLGVHPNRQIGPTMEFGLKPGRVTVLRLGKKDGRLRLFALGGEALDTPQKFLGTSVAVQLDGQARALVERVVADGWEPHFALVYGDIRAELKLLGRLLGIAMVDYSTLS
ncbi:MAG: L-fucose/L-arabinose isomerase family protein [Desulfurispora sp.]|uniref:L-fucose/L-arabinose isomerase family protein n=1 Tax=Desulfurispora sp. TaxID=3014275 RepID=UPI00404B68FE